MKQNEGRVVQTNFDNSRSTKEAKRITFYARALLGIPNLSLRKEVVVEPQEQCIHGPFLFFQQSANTSVLLSTCHAG